MQHLPFPIKSITEVLLTARTSRSYDGNGELIRQSGKCLICITGFTPS